MIWSADDIPDLTGRAAVVTGGNGGLGLETVRALAAAGATVVMAARDQAKATAALADVRGTVPDARLMVVPLDLASLASIRDAATAIRAVHPQLDILVNNAGVMGIPRRETADGFEMQFGVNHLGHWALTSLLMPSLLAADRARVVTVTSTAHHFGRAIDPADPQLRNGYGEWAAYGRSKLANFHFGIGLQRRFEQAGVSAASLLAHPGLSDTDLQTVSVVETDGAPIQRFFRAAASLTGMSPAQGALSQLRAATDPNARGGELYGPLFVTNGPPVRKPILRNIGLDGAIDTLFAVSERETGLAIDIGPGRAPDPLP